MNINNVVIKSFLKKIIYMKSSSDVKLFSNQVLFICRSFYDLKQVVKNWYKRCVHELCKFEFKQISTNSCILRNKKRDIILFLYVDDIFIAVKFKKQMQWFKNEFQKIFKIKNLGKIKKFLILNSFVIVNDA